MVVSDKKDVLRRCHILTMQLQDGSEICERITGGTLLKPSNRYRVFNPRSEKTIYTFFLENKQLKQPCYTGTLYRTLNACHDFDIDQFMKEIVSEIPTFNAFHDADVFMSFFMDHLEEMSIDAIEEVLKIYKRNPQCTNRGRHTSDMKVVDKYLEEHRTNCTERTIDADSVLPD